MAVLVVVACLFLPMDTHSTTQKVQTMKRTFKSLLAVAGLAFIGLGSLLTTTPAQAALTYTNITVTNARGTITCKRFDGDPYPGNSNFYYCADMAAFGTDGTPNYVRAQRYKPSGGNLFGPTMSASNVEFFIFEDASAYRIFFDIDATWLTGRTEYGWAELDPTVKTPQTPYGLPRPRISLVRKWTFPGGGAILVNQNIPGTMDHEVGHFFNWWVPPSFNGSRQAELAGSLRPPYYQLVEQDIVRLSNTTPGVWKICNNVFVSDPRVCNTSTGQPLSQFVGNTPWQILQKLNPYYFDPTNVTGTNSNPTDRWVELYSEMISTAGNQTTDTAGNRRRGDIRNLMKCSWLYANRRYVNAREPSNTEYTGNGCTIPTP